MNYLTGSMNPRVGTTSADHTYRMTDKPAYHRLKNGLNRPHLAARVLLALKSEEVGTVIRNSGAIPHLQYRAAVRRIRTTSGRRQSRINRPRRRGRQTQAEPSARHHPDESQRA